MRNHNNPNETEAQPSEMERTLDANGDTTIRVMITGLPTRYHDPAKEAGGVCIDRLAELMEA